MIQAGTDTGSDALSFELLLDAIVLGMLVGCFYAAVSIGLSISFGLLDVPQVAHPAMLLLGSYGTYLLGRWGLDPLLAGVILMPVFFLFGMALYRGFYEVFEKRGEATGIGSLAFFFGVALIIEVGLIMIFGVDQRAVEARYIGSSITVGDIPLPIRMVVAFVVALLFTGGLIAYLSKTFTGRAIRAVAQDEGALKLMGVDPVRIKQWAFGIATATTALAGALLIVITPVDPNYYRLYIGRTFCVVVLAGPGSMGGTLIAGLILGISESIVLTMFGASWAQAVAFGLLLVVLGLRPQGLFGR